MGLPQRKNIRLKGYDYGQSGVYFITICIKDRQCLLWENNAGVCIVRSTGEQDLKLSETGKVIDIAINNIHEKYPNILVDKYVIMPNHLHMILMLQGGDKHEISSGLDIRTPIEDKSHGGRALRAPTISSVINQMKGYVTKHIGYTIWQKSFYDHVIRNEAEYREIWIYIETNPLKWQDDCYYNENNC